FFKSLRGVERSSTVLKPAQPVEECSERGAYAQRAVAPRAGSVAPSPPLPQAKPRALWHPERGTFVPPFLEYGKAVASPPHPCKVLGFGLACRLGRPLSNVPPGRSGPQTPQAF